MVDHKMRTDKVLGRMHAQMARRGNGNEPAASATGMHNEKIAPRQGRGKMIAMPSTQRSLYHHVVFSTKDRTPTIATACLADVVCDVKAVSSRWVHEEIGGRRFAWQGGETPPPRVAPFANASRGRRNASSKSKRNGED